VTIDAVFTLEVVDCPFNIPVKRTPGPKANVVKFVNYYQRKGGQYLVNVTDAQGYSQAVWGGTVFSRMMRGKELGSQAKQTTQIQVDTDPNWRMREVTQPWSDPLGMGWMQGRNVNHDAMPWYLKGSAVADLA
jgi:hypothetical protein